MAAATSRAAATLRATLGSATAPPASLRAAFVVGAPLRRHMSLAPRRGLFSLPRRLSRLAAAASSVETPAATAAAGTAAPGDYVEVHYVGTLDDGSQFDSSRERGEPLPVTLGAGMVVPGFEAIITGMALHEQRTQRVEPAQAYGEWDEQRTAKIPAKSAPEGLEQGATVQLKNGMQAVVSAIDDEFVTIDANMPLAGKALTFDVELTKLVPAAQLELATFGAGCFWSVELAFQRLPGVVSTAAGYSQGSVENATYADVCGGESGHNEVVQVRYNAAEVSYEALLDAFWEKHDPTTPNRQGNDVGAQYRSGIYTHTPAQRAAAEASLARVNAERFGGRVVTEIEAVRNFCVAEEEHQQYLARGGRFGRAQSAAKSCTDPIRCYG